MQMKARAAVRTGLLAAVACFAAVSTASATTVKCQQTVAKAAGAYAQARAKSLEGCEQAKIKGKLPAGTVCTTEPKTLGNLVKASDKLNKDIATACGGKDKICGVDTDGTEDSPSSIGFPNSCQNLENGTCNGAINHCGDVAQCLKCVADSATDQTSVLYHGDLVPGTTGNKVLNKCQSTIGAEASKFLQAKSKILQKCWDARLSGKHNDVCPNPAAADKTPARKAADDIAKAEAKKVAAICKACGGGDKACGGADDLTVAAIGFTPSCTDVQVPGGQDCGAIGTVDTLDELVQCVDCVTEYKVDCLDRGTVPEFLAYPTECNSTPPPPTCTTAQVTIVTTFTPPLLPDFAAGVATTVSYPGPKLDIPGSGNAATVLARVTNLTGVSGTLSAGDNNLIPDAFDDSIAAGLISLTSPGIPAGNFVKIAFDCRVGAPAPTLGEFSCASDVSDFDGSAGNNGTLTSSCQVTNLVTTP